MALVVAVMRCGCYANAMVFGSTFTLLALLSFSLRFSGF